MQAEPAAPGRPDRSTRLIRLMMRLLSGTAPGTEALAEELGVRAPTLRKDMALLRRATGWPLAWSSSDQAWRLDGVTFPIHLPPGTALVLDAIALALARQSRGPLGAAGERIAHAVYGALDETLRRACDRLVTTTDGDVLEALTTAIAERRPASVTYRTRGESGQKQRKMYPERLEYCGGHLYVWCSHIKAQKCLPHRVDRISSVRLGPERLPAPFAFAEPNGPPENRVGIFGSPDVVEVRCVVEREIADLVETEPPCRDFRVVDRNHAATTFVFRVSHLVAFARWALRFADGLTVVAPDAAVREMRRAISKALARHRPERAAMAHVGLEVVEEPRPRLAVEE